MFFHIPGFALDIGTSRYQCLKTKNQLRDGREGLRAEGRGSEGRLRVCKDFGSLPMHVFRFHVVADHT